MFVWPGFFKKKNKQTIGRTRLKSGGSVGLCPTYFFGELLLLAFTVRVSLIFAVVLGCKWLKLFRWIKLEKILFLKVIFWRIAVIGFRCTSFFDYFPTFLGRTWFKFRFLLEACMPNVGHLCFMRIFWVVLTRRVCCHSLRIATKFRFHESPAIATQLMAKAR